MRPLQALLYRLATSARCLIALDARRRCKSQHSAEWNSQIYRHSRASRERQGAYISSGCHGILARCCASQMQPFPFGTQRPESLLPQLARLSIQTVSWRASQKDPGAYVLPHGTVHQHHAWNIDQLHGWIDALSPNIDTISVLTYSQF